MSWPTDITAMDKGRVLEVAFDDGQVIRLTAERLRVESPSAEVQGHSPSQKKIDHRQGERRHRRNRAGWQLRDQDRVRRRTRHRPLHLGLSAQAREVSGRLNGMETAARAGEWL